MKSVNLLCLIFVLWVQPVLYGQEKVCILEKILKEKYLAGYHNIKLDNEGNYLVTGFFEDSLNLGYRVVYSRGLTDMFIARFDKDLNLQWIKLAGGNHVDICKLLHTDTSNNIYISGLFKGLVYWGDTIIQSPGRYNYFTAKYTENGDLIWIKQNRLK
jgi:hypothetical protein